MSENHNYIKFNNIAIIGHFISAASMIGLTIGKDPLIIPYTESYLEWKQVSSNSSCPLGSRDFDTSNGNFCINTVTKPVSCNSNNECYGINLGWLIISFHLLSFGFQLVAGLTNCCHEGLLGYRYSDMIQLGKNPLRFIEYSFSASIMLIAIALLNGVTDINLITSIAVLTSACQLCGLAVEYVESVSIKWLLHLTGWLQFFWAYGIIGHAFLKSVEASGENSGVKPPDFVYIIVIVLFLLYASFGFVQLTELLYTVPCIKNLCCKNSETLNPFTKEKCYVILSLTAKLLLGWMIFSNVLILS